MPPRKGIASYADRVVILAGAKGDRDSFGERPESHAPTVEYWARRENVRGGEGALFNAVRQTTATITLAIPGRPPVTPQDKIRIKVSGVEFDIDSAEYDRDAHETILTCSSP